jgi:hypothetical protein
MRKLYVHNFHTVWWSDTRLIAHLALIRGADVEGDLCEQHSNKEKAKQKKKIEFTDEQQVST